MEFGKVDRSMLAQIDLQLPVDDPRTWIQLHRARAGAKPATTMGPSAPEPSSPSLNLRLGCPVWGAKSWLGRVYPAHTKPTDFLHFYAEQFESIELNTTHYRIPDESTIRRWREVTPASFRFCPKFPQEISHARSLSQMIASTREFVGQILALEERLGMSFLQLPAHFAPQDLPELRKFLLQLPQGFELAVEVRHPGFFHDHQLIAPLFDLLAARQVHAVILDVAGRRDVLHLSLPTDKSMVRFIVNDLDPTDLTRMQQWSERVVSWSQLGLKEMWFFVHQPDDVRTPEAMAVMTDLFDKTFDRLAPTALAHPLKAWKPAEELLKDPKIEPTTETAQLGFQL